MFSAFLCMKPPIDLAMAAKIRVTALLTLLALRHSQTTTVNAVAAHEKQTQVSCSLVGRNVPPVNAATNRCQKA